MEKQMAKLLRFDGTSEEVKPADPKSGFSLAEMYTLIGCEMIEVIYLSSKPGYILIIDEEGKYRPDVIERSNEEATTLLISGNHIEGDFITGNALLIEDNGTEFQ
jgi:hypothetical protein